MTAVTATVARLFLDDPARSRYGYELRQAVSEVLGQELDTDKMYPLLARMVTAGHLRWQWQEPGANHGKPARRLYTITPAGIAWAREELALLWAAIGAPPAAPVLPAG